jgi:hypothetical protein
MPAWPVGKEHCQPNSFYSSLCLVAMLASTFRQHYKNPKVDPYRGSYKNVLAEFVVLDKNWKAKELAV